VCGLTVANIERGTICSELFGDLLFLFLSGFGDYVFVCS